MNIDTGLTIDQLKGRWRFIFEESTTISKLTEDHTMAYLAEQAQGKVVVESGTYYGASAYVMLAAGAKKVHCIDPFFEPGSKEIAERSLAKWIESGQACIWHMRCQEAAWQIQRQEGAVDMVFVDDGHEQCEVEYDIDWLYPLLKSGGLICGHDLDPGGSVERAVKGKLPGYSEPVPRLWAFIKP